MQGARQESSGSHAAVPGGCRSEPGDYTKTLREYKSRLDCVVIRYELSVKDIQLTLGLGNCTFLLCGHPK